MNTLQPYRSKKTIQTSFFCRGYLCGHRKLKGCYHAIYRPKRANWWLPRSFDFTGPKEDLEDYIEALVFKSQRALEYEENGHVLNLVYHEGPKAGEEVGEYQISPERLWQVLLGNDPLSLPETCGVTFGREDGFYLPRNVLGYLVSQELWRDLSKDIESYAKFAAGQGCTFRWSAVRKAIHAELIPLEQVRPDGSIIEDEELQRQRREIISEEEVGQGAVETISRITQAGQSWFARDVLYDGRVIYRGVSSSLMGPWETLESSPATCALLEIPIGDAA